MHLFDLDGDGRKEIVVADNSGNFWVFQWRDGKLKMWQGKVGIQRVIAGIEPKLVKFGDQLALCALPMAHCLAFSASHLA
jgi:hypothetical protein